MREGMVVERFSVKAKDGKPLKVVFRLPRLDDAQAALKMVNSVRDEAEFLGQRHHETMKSEKKFIKSQIKNIKRRAGVFLFVEVNSELVGCASIQPHKLDSSPHVGEFGIMLREEFTGFGIGTRLARKVLQLARTKTMFRIIESRYFANNKRSRRLHKKLGFKVYGRLPKACMLKDGSYCDSVHLYKFIKKV